MLYLCATSILCIDNILKCAGRLSEKVLREHFHLPLSEVAKKFGMCTTAFKKTCRKQGVMQWPHRTLRSLEKKIASLRAEQKFTNDHNSIDEQVRKLQIKRESILSGTGLSNLESDDLITSPSEDGSSTGRSGSSSPRAHEVLSALVLDDSSSVGSSSSLSEERHRTGTALSAAAQSGGDRSLEYPQMPGQGMLGSEKGGPWDKSFLGHAVKPRGGQENNGDVAQMDSRDPFDTMPPGHEQNEIMQHMRGSGMAMPRGGMPGHGGSVPGDVCDRHEAHRRAALGALPFGSGGLGMHPQMAEGMRMRGMYPGGGIPGGGMTPMHGGAMNAHMMWYKDQEHMGRSVQEHAGPDPAFFGMSEHPASNARLQQQVNFLLTENHNLRCVIRTMTTERDDFARKQDGLLPCLAVCVCVCVRVCARVHVFVYLYMYK